MRVAKNRPKTTLVISEYAELYRYVDKFVRGWLNCLSAPPGVQESTATQNSLDVEALYVSGQAGNAVGFSLEFTGH